MESVPTPDGSDEVLGEDADAPRDGEPDGTDDTVLPPVTEVPGCGNGIVEDDEECDDGNRLDGDGCDWLCRLGDGDPPPEPEPGVTDYVPEGAPLPLPDTSVGGTSLDRLPLVWTGSAFATAWYEPGVADGAPGRVRLRRFDRSGRALDSEWTYPTLALYGGMELVWTGAGFGLFYVDIESGLWYLRLDESGKPIGEPVLIEPDPRARAPAADLAPDGAFVVAWVREMGSALGWSWCSSDGPPDQVRVRRVTADGAVDGPVVTVDEWAQGPPDVAAGEDGVGLSLTVQVDGGAFCAARFVRLDAALGSPVFSGILGGGEWSDVKWVPADRRWVTAWTYAWYEGEDLANEVRVARFTPDGALAEPPVRNRMDGAALGGAALRIAAGDGGMALFGAWNDDRSLSYLRTDRRGVSVAPLRDVWTGSSLHAYNTVWSDVGFARLYVVDDASGSSLRLQHFTAAG